MSAGDLIRNKTTLWDHKELRKKTLKMEDFMSKEHYRYKIYALLMKSSA